jgi:hypothetical protein
MLEWLSYPLTFLGGVGLTLLTHYLSNQKDKKKQEQLRFDIFYAPYIQSLYENNSYYNDFSNLNKSEKEKYIELIITNIRHLDTKSQNLYPSLYNAYALTVVCDQMGTENDKISANTQFGDVLVRFNDTVLNEAKTLCYTLQLKDISATYRLLHAQSKRNK